jgi:hypothetical protein
MQSGFTGAKITSAGCGLIKTASGGKIKLGAPKPFVRPEQADERPTLKRRVPDKP